MGRPKKTQIPNDTEHTVAEAAMENEAQYEPYEPGTEAPAPIHMVVEKKQPDVKIVFIDSCIPNNEIRISRTRSIHGSGRIFTVSREMFDGEFITETTDKLLRNRKLIVLSGLTDEERKQYGCYYEKGEVLTGERMFDFFFDYPVKDAADMFALLCPEHQRMVASRFVEAYFDKRDNRVTRERVEAFNEISLQNDQDGLFTKIVEDINEKKLKRKTA